MSHGCLQEECEAKLVRANADADARVEAAQRRTDQALAELVRQLVLKRAACVWAGGGGGRGHVAACGQCNGCLCYSRDTCAACRC
jgi:hypothetical protein